MLKENKEENTRTQRREALEQVADGIWRIGVIAAESFAGTQQLPDQGKRARPSD